MRNEFIDVEVGDEIVVDRYSGGFGHYYHAPSIRKVTKVTSTQFTAGTERFMKSSGSVVGESHSYYGNYASEYATVQVKQDIADRVAQQQAEIDVNNVIHSLTALANQNRQRGKPVATLKAITAKLESAVGMLEQDQDGA